MPPGGGPTVFGRGQQAPDADFNPNDPATPVTTWSFTLSGGGGDVPRIWCDKLKDYFVLYNMKGAIALERGKQNRRLHCQAVFETHSFADNITARRFYNHMRAFIPIAQGTPAKFTMKPLAPGQTFQHMLGYIQKDSNQSHFAFRSNLVSEQDIAEARNAYHEVSENNYWKGKVIITKANFAKLMHAHWHANYAPFLVPPDFQLLAMCQSGMYVPSHSWLTAAQGRNADIEMTHNWLLMARRPTATNLQMVQELFFGFHHPQQAFRYWKLVAPSERAGLTPNLAACFDKIEQYAEDCEGVRRVCRLLLTYCQQNAWDMTKHDTLDMLFAEAFDAVYRTTGGEVPPMAAPRIQDDEVIAEDLNTADRTFSAMAAAGRNYRVH
ncbi:hypothetical protein COO60DRAFT_1631842 [Scenedesmus sp. NREL 46B-D3]|nr:hypothetical protein COO60DRAFT_1631842 [Scenedesmus sp. NREL 46B-D3]